MILNDESATRMSRERSEPSGRNRRLPLTEERCLSAQNVRHEVQVWGAATDGRLINCDVRCKTLISAFFFALLFIFASVQAYALNEEEKIIIIIESVKNAPEGTQFIRNGKAHSAADAVSHLNLKYSRVKSKIKTADEFIKHVGSASSLSGKEYLIRYPDGITVTTAAFFTEKLRALENER